MADSWANPGNTSTPTIDDGGATTAGGALTSSQVSESTGGGVQMVATALSVCDFCLFGLMTALGVLSLLGVHESGVENQADFNQNIASRAFMAVYMLLFALLLFLYELMWWMPIGSLNVMLRRNFGFLYGLRGKGLYLIFIAFLTIGLITGASGFLRGLAWATGVSFLVVGSLHLAVTFTNPDVVDRYKPPTAGLDRINTGQENVV